MKKSRQRYEFEKKQDAYRKQIEYYEEDMRRMQKEMDDLSSMYGLPAAGGSSTTTTQPPPSTTVRPQASSLI